MKTTAGVGLVALGVFIWLSISLTTPVVSLQNGYTGRALGTFKCGGSIFELIGLTDTGSLVDETEPGTLERQDAEGLVAQCRRTAFARVAVATVLGGGVVLLGSALLTSGQRARRRKDSEHQTPAKLMTPGWWVDPTGEHKFRWHDGLQWTAKVSDGESPSQYWTGPGESF